MGHSAHERPAKGTSKSSFEGDDGDPRIGLDDRLRGFVVGTSDDPSRSWADRILGALVAGAVRGDFRSQHEVFRRIGGASDSHRDVATFSIDDATARKVLEAVRGPVKDRSVA
jgi:hypothetical protein